MQHYKTIKELIKAYKQLAYRGGLDFPGERQDKGEEAEFWVLSSDEEFDENTIETEYGDIPESLVEFDVAYFLEVGIFQDIIVNKLEHNESLTTDDTEELIGAIHHYLEYDDFQD